MKYAIPTDDGNTVAKVFGRARSFAIGEGGEYEIVENAGSFSEHGAGTGAVAFLRERGVRLIASSEIGPKAAQALSAAGMRTLPAAAGAALSDIALRAGAM
jgi:predicted Fe-Mo cluster-binding NifX family protein